MSLPFYSALPVLCETHHGFANSLVHAFSHVIVLYELVKSKVSYQDELSLLCLHRKQLPKNRKTSY